MDDLVTTIARVRAAGRAGAAAPAAVRHDLLGALRQLLDDEAERFHHALAEDLRKPPLEAELTELAFLRNEIDHAVANLDAWMAPTTVKVPMTLRPARAEIRPQPLGAITIIAPWNYPLHLTLGPLIGVFAAGNTAIVKPSEYAPATAAAIDELLPRYVAEHVGSDYVAVVNGGVDVTTALLAEPVDHIVYTGGGEVAKVVMRAAAEHLTPVTLELGGKSPAIVAADADLDVAARRIAWGRFTNAGQTCVAPDYVLVDETVERDLLGALLRAVHDFYSGFPQASDDYARIVNERHFDRLVGLLDAGGYEAVITGGVHDRAERYFAPTILGGVSPDSKLMSEEIFGPILPVLTVADVDAAIDAVNTRPDPLALYVFTDDDTVADRVIDATHSGGAAVNATMLHLAVPGLPFGGVGASGHGAYHGEAGFRRFSHQRSVFNKGTKPDPSLLYPPYKRWKDALLRRFF